MHKVLKQAISEDDLVGQRGLQCFTFFSKIFLGYDILLVVPNCASLARIKFDSMDKLGNSVHCDDRLDILLF